MNKTFYKTKATVLIVIMCILILTGAFFVYEKRHEYFITAKFPESGPLYKNMPVFYKGYKIGRVQKVHPSEDYKYTLVKIHLYPKNPKIPEETIAKVKKLDMRKDYIDLLPPDEPSKNILKKGSTIAGEPAFDLDAFLSEIADSGLIVPLLQTFSDTLLNLGKTSTEIRNFFADSRLILKENRQNITQTTEGFAKTAKSLNTVSRNLNRSFSEDKLNNTSTSVDKTATNIASASESVKNIASSVDCATRNLDKTMAKIDCTISEVNSVASNLKSITSGLKETLGKRFAGIRIIFGKPLKGDGCNQCCPKGNTK